ncbi:hypothetical protein [Nocardia asteroides]|uniref:hypothetical protein n=1 Tax=Nocardia asteroides TaxID=1824 RepID=UPI00366523C9
MHPPARRAQRTGLPRGSGPGGPYLTPPRGISFEQETIRWADFALSVIDRRVDVLV